MHPYYCCRKFQHPGLYTIIGKLAPKCRLVLPTTVIPRDRGSKGFYSANVQLGVASEHSTECLCSGSEYLCVVQVWPLSAVHTGRGANEIRAERLAAPHFPLVHIVT